MSLSVQLRYKDTNVVCSRLNHLVDVRCWIEGLTSANYVRKILQSRHRITGSMNPASKSKVISNFVNIACKYLEQAENGPVEVSFLPIYYALLNLSKVYVLIGPYCDELARNRRHGASYNPDKPMLLLHRDYINLHAKGAIPLFYKTLVNEAIPTGTSTHQPVYMCDVYPYIVDVEVEYRMATKQVSRVIAFQVAVNEKTQGKLRMEAISLPETKKEASKVKISALQGLKGLQRTKKGSSHLISKLYTNVDVGNIRQAHLRPSMLYSRYSSNIPDGFVYIPVSDGRLLLPEELPILLAYYHIAYIVRYEPDYLKKLINSEVWPLLLVLRRHALFRFLLLSWSFINQCDTHILHD